MAIPSMAASKALSDCARKVAKQRALAAAKGPPAKAPAKPKAAKVTPPPGTKKVEAKKVTAKQVAARRKATANALAKCRQQCTSCH